MLSMRVVPQYLEQLVQASVLEELTIQQLVQTGTLLRSTGSHFAQGHHLVHRHRQVGQHHAEIRGRGPSKFII